MGKPMNEYRIRGTRSISSITLADIEMSKSLRILLGKKGKGKKGKDSESSFLKYYGMMKNRSIRSCEVDNNTEVTRSIQNLVIYKNKSALKNLIAEVQ